MARVWNRIIWRDMSGAEGELQLRDISLESYVRRVHDAATPGGSDDAPPSSPPAPGDGAGTGYAPAPPIPVAPAPR